MEAGFIHFDPASEFEVIENIEFEEEISRPESLRFYTLDEQLLDYFDKVLPKKGKVTKFEYTKIAGEVDRIRDIYENVITVTDSDYKVDFSRKTIRVDWVKPIYTNNDLSPYSFETNWNPLFSKETRSTPNYYPRLLSALPKPFKTVGTNGVSYTKGGILVDEEGENAIHTLPVYERTKGVVHEDGSFSVVKIPMTNTADDIHTKGFFIQQRSFAIPNPLADHPFLSSNQPSKFLTEEPLERVFPTIEAIMTHAIPKTSDPYKEGKKILKAYDLQLSQIPWNLWKDTFAPVDTITATPPAVSVVFSSLSEETAPSKKLQDIYMKKWYLGIEPRFWLATQEDNGTLVSKMLLSNAGKSGLVPPAILSEKPVSSLVPSSPEECLLVDSFDSFLNSGVYRSPPWSEVNTAVDKHKPMPLGNCVPVAQIVQEKADFLVGDKIAWKESTDEEILKEHQQLLKFFQFSDEKPVKTNYEAYAGKEQSDLRRQILAVLKDETRLPVDQSDAIGKLLRGSSMQNNVYFDSSDLFLICSHTLSILKGDLENDNDAFYLEWTTVDEGFRACKFCGEQLSSDVYAAQDDFDEDGNVMKSSDVLGGISSEEPHMAAFANSIQKLKPAFLLDNPGEAILYLLISLLQVLPLESQLLPILQNVRDLTSVLKANKKIEKSIKERTEGILGIAAMVVLLQTHNPFLIPRRSFGSKILKLTGFPRDTDNPAESAVLDILISVLKTTFESSPNTFKGPTTTLLRLVISKPKEVRKESIVFLKQAAQKFKMQLLAAKERYEVPSNTIATTQLSLPVLTVTNTVFQPGDALQEEQSSACNIFLPHTYLSGKLPPNVSQEKIILTSAKPSENALYVQTLIPTISSVSFSDAEIRRRVSLKFPKGTKLEKLEAFLQTDTDGIAFLSLANRLMDILSRESFSIETLSEYRRISVFLETTIHKSLLRDASRGVLYELLHDVTKDKNKSGLLAALQTAVQRDLVLSMILLTKEQATSQDSDLRTRERELFKTRMRNMNDTEREATKMLLDIGIAPYIITNEDREIFAKEYRLPDPELGYAQQEQAEDVDRPEEGYNASRDVEDDQAAIVNGVEQQVDYGDYGDRREERFNRDYETNQDFDYDEGYGV